MLKFGRKPSYSKNLDVLVAVITHLGYTDWNMRSAKNLAKALNIEQSSVQYVCDHFKSLFRKSTYKSKAGTEFYQLQVRHALRWRDSDVYDIESKELPLDATIVNAMLAFVVSCADHERRSSLGYVTAWLAAVVSIAAAILALTAKNGC
ncbi:hypothetical protein FHR49_001361 [Xanthomonas campestris]